MIMEVENGCAEDEFSLQSVIFHFQDCCQKSNILSIPKCSGKVARCQSPPSTDIWIPLRHNLNVQRKNGFLNSSFGRDETEQMFEKPPKIAFSVFQKSCNITGHRPPH